MRMKKRKTPFRLSRSLSRLLDRCCRPEAGLGLVLTGVVVLAAGFAFRFTAHNAVLLVGFALVAAGVADYVWALKRQSRY